MERPRTGFMAGYCFVVEFGIRNFFGEISHDRLDSLGCHFRARMSGRTWQQRRIVRYYLHRWPSRQAMKRLREKIRDRSHLKGGWGNGPAQAPRP